MKYRFIAEHRQEYPVSTMCRVLEVAVSGFYAWHKRAPSRRSQQNTGLGEQIARIYQQNRQVYGSPRIHAVLRAEGQSCGKKRVARLMRERGLSARPRKHRTRTTDSQHEQPVAPNLLNREFTATAPNTKWVTDITAVWTTEGWLYLAVVLDIFSRLVVGWAMDAHRDEALVEQAARMALAQRQPEPGLLHHSDRGSQYSATDYRELLTRSGIVMSMSGKGDCYDNALMESFFGTLKSECVDRQSFVSRAQARLVIFEYLEVFYNRQRLHSSLGYVSPVTYELQAK
jgi:transposase InsO family protein